MTLQIETERGFPLPGRDSKTVLAAMLVTLEELENEVDELKRTLSHCGRKVDLVQRLAEQLTNHPGLNQV